MVQNRTESVACIRLFYSEFHGFGDGHSEATCRIRETLLHEASYFGCSRRRRNNRSAIGMHNRLAVRFLLVAGVDHEDRQVESEVFASDGQSRTPLTGASLGGHVLDTLFLIVIGLRNSRVQFVRTHRADTFILEVNLRGCIQGFFQTAGAYQRCRTVNTI